jgi:hypothetical protein
MTRDQILMLLKIFLSSEDYGTDLVEQHDQ